MWDNFEEIVTIIGTVIVLACFIKQQINDKRIRNDGFEIFSD